MKKTSDETFDCQETQSRLGKLLRGAFTGPPTLLAKIPTREGRKRTKGEPSRARVTKKKA